MLTSEQDLYWLAGWLEGEGTFCIRECTSKGYTYKVAAIVGCSTDYDVVKRASKLLVVNINIRPRQQEHYKKLYVVAVNGLKAIEWMKKLYPLMGKRRQEAIDNTIAHATKRTWITYDIAEQVRATYNSTNLTYSQIGEIYGISSKMSSRIVRGLSWKSKDT